MCKENLRLETCVYFVVGLALEAGDRVSQETVSIVESSTYMYANDSRIGIPIEV